MDEEWVDINHTVVGSWTQLVHVHVCDCAVILYMYVIVLLYCTCVYSLCTVFHYVQRYVICQD